VVDDHAGFSAAAEAMLRIAVTKSELPLGPLNPLKSLFETLGP